MDEKERDLPKDQDLLGEIMKFRKVEVGGRGKSGRKWLVIYGGVEGMYIDVHVVGNDMWVLDLDGERVFPIGGEEITPWIYVWVKEWVYKSCDWGKSWDLYVEGIKRGERRKIFLEGYGDDPREYVRCAFSYEKGGLDWGEVIKKIEEEGKEAIVWFGTDKEMMLVLAVMRLEELENVKSKRESLMLLWKLIMKTCRILL